MVCQVKLALKANEILQDFSIRQTSGGSGKFPQFRSFPLFLNYQNQDFSMRQNSGGSGKFPPFRSFPCSFCELSKYRRLIKYCVHIWQEKEKTTNGRNLFSNPHPWFIITVPWIWGNYIFQVFQLPGINNLLNHIFPCDGGLIEYCINEALPEYGW